MKKFLNNKGQVAVEYTMMLVVVVTMAVSAFNIIREKFIADKDADCSDGSVNPVCIIKSVGFDPDAQVPFRRFRLLR